MILLGGAWVEKPVMFGAPNWRTGAPSAPAFTGRAMIKNSSVVKTAPSSSPGAGIATGWSPHPDYPGSAIFSHRLQLPEDLVGQFRVRARVNAYFSNNNLLPGFYVNAYISGVYSKKVIDLPAQVTGPLRAEVSGLHEFRGGESVSVYIYRDTSFSSTTDDTRPNYVIVESV